MTDTANLSNFLDTPTISTEKYVKVLEERIEEQKQLIHLLNEKIASLERGKEHSSYAATVQKDRPSRSFPLPDDPEKSVPHFIIGSRKTKIEVVKVERYAPFFVSRIFPDTSAAELATDLRESVPELAYVRCSKLKTRHLSYSSYHVVVPENQRDLVLDGGAWPEGAFIKRFSGRLLESYILETFDSRVIAGTDSVSMPVNKSASKVTKIGITKNATTAREKRVAPAERRVLGRSSNSGVSRGLSSGFKSPSITPTTSKATPPSKNSRVMRSQNKP